MRHLFRSFRMPAAIALGVGAALALSSCMNVFDPVDNPSGDAQILAAARAAFDQGDLEKAAELYAKIPGNQNAIAETIFLDLDRCGANIGAIGSALATGINNSGMILTILAEKMVQAHGTDCLARLLAAYKSSRNLTTAQLRGFAGFLSSIAIAAEVMAHNTGIQDGTLKIADYVVEGQCPACALDACEVTDGIAAAAAADLANDATIAVTFGTIAGAVSAAKTAMDDMGITSSPALNLLNTIGAGASANQIFRCALYSAGVGRP